MSNNKQTAVEWLIEQVKSEKYIEDINFEQAKAMHKQDILDAWEDGQGSFPTRNEEQYYNETFGEQ